MATGAEGIRVPIGSGIAGSVAKSGDTLNISDAYKDPRFNPSFDKQSGYRTKTIMAAAVRDMSGLKKKKKKKILSLSLSLSLSLAFPIPPFPLFFFSENVLHTPNLCTFVFFIFPSCSREGLN